MVNQTATKSQRGFTTRLALLFAVLAVTPYLTVRLFVGAGLGEPLQQLLLLILMGLAGWLVGASFERRMADRLRRYRRAVRRLGYGEPLATLGEKGDGALGLLGMEIEEAARNFEAMRERYGDRETSRDLEVNRLRAEVTRLGNENIQLQCEILQMGKAVSSLQDFVVAINKMSDQAQIAGQLLTYIDNEVDYDIATVMLLDPETQRLAPVAISNREKGSRLVGKYIKDIQALQPLGSKSVLGRVMEAGKPLLLGNVESDRRGLATRENVKAELGVPLKVQDKVIGALHLEASQNEVYTPEHVALLTLLANASATAIGNIRLFEEEAKVRMLREMDKVKSQLISTVSHELRTPLAAIKGYSTSLQRPEGKLDEHTRREFLEIIEEEADRLSEMIENLLDLSKIEAGVLHLHKQTVQLERIVRKVLDQAKQRAPNHKLRLRFPADCPGVFAAPHRIEQVVRNLVDNAIKYSPEGGRITVSGDVENDHLVISVSDEGLGIPSEQLDRVFEPFYQVDGGTTRRVGGSGLGLAISRGFVQAHGGEIWAESTLEKGSTFKFRLPLRNLETLEAAQAGAH